MAHVSYSKLRDNLASYMDEVCNGRAPLVITRRNARSVVLMAEEDYDGLIETAHLLNSANAAGNALAIGQIAPIIPSWHLLRSKTLSWTTR